MKLSIKSKILILSLSCTLIGTLTLGSLSTLFISRITHRHSMQLIKDQTNAEALKINLFFGEHEKYAQALAAGILSQIKQDSLFFADKKRLAEHSKDIKERIASTASSLTHAKTIYVRFNPRISTPEAGAFFVKGDVTNDPLSSVTETNISQYSPNDVEHVGWYYKPIQAGKPIWLPPYLNKNINVYMISYVIPMFLDNQEIGVTGVDVDFEEMTRQMSKIRFMKSGYAYLEDNEGLIAYHPSLPNDLTFKPSNDQVKTSVQLFNGMSFVSIVPRSEINAQRNKLLLQSTLFILFILILTTALTMFFAKSITSPLKKLTEEAKKMITGDMNAEFNISQNDEIGELAKSFAAAKLHICQYMKQMQGIAYRDSLTGVRNKMAYDSYLIDLDADIEHGEVTSYGVVVLDTNNLKEINDTYGHENGNEYLINSCKLICQIFRHSPVFRIGGDEFIVILTGEDLENHKELLRRLKESQSMTRSASFPWKQISIACGFAVAEDAKATTYVETFNKADDNMYKNKRAIKIPPKTSATQKDNSGIDSNNQIQNTEQASDFQNNKA